MKLIMESVDRLPSNRSRKDYAGQAADIFKALQALDSDKPMLVGEGTALELNNIATHLRKQIGKTNVVVKCKEGELYQLFAQTEPF